MFETSEPWSLKTSQPTQTLNRSVEFFSPQLVPRPKSWNLTVLANTCVCRDAFSSTNMDLEWVRQEKSNRKLPENSEHNRPAKTCKIETRL